MEILRGESAYSDLGLGFVLSQERFAEKGLRVQGGPFFSEFIKSLIAFGDGFVTAWDDNDPILGKTSESGSFQTGTEDGMVNDEQLGPGCVELVQQFVDGEGWVGRCCDSTEPVSSPGSDGELHMVRSEESDAVAIAYIPASLHNVRKSVGASSDLLAAVALACVVVNEPWGGLRTHRTVWVLIIEEELGNGHVGGNVWDSANGGDEFLDGFLRHDDYGWDR